MEDGTRLFGEHVERVGKHKFWLGLRGRFITLLMAGLLPIAGSLAWATWQINQIAEREGGELALKIAEEFAEEYTDALKRTEAAMRHLQEFEVALLGGFPACQRIFKSIVAQHDFLTNVWITNSDGLQFCNDVGAEEFSRADRPDFLQARETGHFSVGQYRIGQATRRAVIPVSVPLFNTEGRFAGTLGASIDMQSIVSRMHIGRTINDIVFTIVNEHGIIIYRNIDPEAFVGKPAPRRLVQLPSGVDRLVQRAQTFDNIPTMLAVVRIANPPMTVRAGIPTSELRRTTATILSYGIPAVAASATLALLIAYFGVDRLVVKPTRYLQDVTNRISQGDTQLVALPPISAPDELGDVAASVHQMARELVIRTKEISEARDILSDAIESASNGIVLYDREDRVLLYSPEIPKRWPEMADVFKVGARFEDLVRIAYERELYVIPPGQDKDQLIADQFAAHRASDGSFEVHKLSNGKVFRVATRLTQAGGRVAVAIDVTDQLEYERKLREAQKMEAIGQLTGGIAHDFNNQLSVIIGNLELAKASLPEDPQLLRHVERALIGANRSADLTRSLLAFARQQPLDPKICSVNGSISEAVHLLDRILGEDIEVVVHTAQPSWSVLVDEAQLISCVLNLAANSRDAMPEGGTLTIVVRNVDAGKEDALGALDLTFEQYVAIEVSDTGTGMTPEILAKVFEPFFTTKEIGKGTGLGLSMVHGFINQSGGHIAIRSEADQGTTVQIYLPRVEERRAASASGAVAPEPLPVGKATVLVVEDNEGVRQVALKQLESLGYRVIEAVDGLSARAILDESDQNIDLLFTDVVMPGKMDGYALAREATRRRPGIKVLLTSGYPGKTLQRAGERRQRILAKPYSKTALATAVAAILKEHVS